MKRLEKKKLMGLMTSEKKKFIQLQAIEQQVCDQWSLWAMAGNVDKIIEQIEKTQDAKKCRRRIEYVLDGAKNHQELEKISQKMLTVFFNKAIENHKQHALPKALGANIQRANNQVFIKAFNELQKFALYQKNKMLWDQLIECNQTFVDKHHFSCLNSANLTGLMNISLNSNGVQHWFDCIKGNTIVFEKESMPILMLMSFKFLFLHDWCLESFRQLKDPKILVDNIEKVSADLLIGVLRVLTEEGCADKVINTPFEGIFGPDLHHEFEKQLRQIDNDSLFNQLMGLNLSTEPNLQAEGFGPLFENLYKKMLEEKVLLKIAHSAEQKLSAAGDKKSFGMRL